MNGIKVSKKLCRIALPLIGGQIIGKITVKNARRDYSKNVKPPLSPPGYVFPIVWPTLYLSMGIAHDIISQQKQHQAAQATYYLQLGLNYLWSLLYFKYKLRGAALIDSYILFSAVVATAVQFYQKHRIAGYLLIPYICWSAFASYMATGNWLLNKDNPDYTAEHHA